jgi:hypothetical protein
MQLYEFVDITELPVGPISSHTHTQKGHIISVLLEHVHWYHTEGYMSDYGS